MKAQYRLGSYAIPDLLKLLATTRPDRIQLEVGWPPALFVKGRKSMIDAADLTGVDAERLAKVLLSTRQRRTFRNCGNVQVVRLFNRRRVLVWMVNAFGVFRIDFEPVAARRSAR